MKKIQKLFIILSIVFIILGIVLIRAANLPTVGGDTDTWGTILNNFLQEEHTSNGTHGNITAEDITIKGGPWLDVRAYGAIGDGVTDDTAAIQAAINNASTKGAVVFIPEGTYLVSSSIILYTGVTLQGTGLETKIIAANTLSDSVIKSYAYVNDTLNWTRIIDLQINATNQISGDGIFLRDIGEFTTIDRVEVLSACRNGINIDLNFTSIVLGYISVSDNGRCGDGSGVFVNNSHSSNSHIKYISGDDNQDALLRVRFLNLSNLFLGGFDAEKTEEGKQNYVIWLDAGSRGNLIINSGRISQSNVSQKGNSILYNSIGGTSIGKFEILGGIYYNETSTNYTWYYASDDSTSSNKSFDDLNGRIFSQSFSYYEDAGADQALELEGSLKMISNTIRLFTGFSAGIGFLNSSSNDIWELTTSGTGSESIYWRHVPAGLDNERWSYMWDSTKSPFQVDSLAFMPGGNISSTLILAATSFGRLGIGTGFVRIPVSKLEVNGTVTLNTTDSIPLILARNTSAIACSYSNNGGIIYSSNKHYSCNGTDWNALY